jgi:hypothetical protein
VPAQAILRRAGIAVSVREGEAEVNFLAGLGLGADLGQELVDALGDVVCAQQAGQESRGMR